MCGMYPMHVFFLDWYRGLYEVNKKVFFWMAFMVTTMMAGIPIGIAYNDFAGYASGAIFINLAAMGMVYVGTPYNGMTKQMGLPHGPPLIPPVIYGIIRLSTDLGCSSPHFCPQIAIDNKPGLFIYLILHSAVFGYCIIQDFVDAYVWYIKGNHTVIRSLKSLNELKKRGLLKDDVGQIQVIKIDGKLTSEDINEYGYLIKKDTEASAAVVTM